MRRIIVKKPKSWFLAPVETASFLDFDPLNGLLILGQNSKKYSVRLVPNLKKSPIFTAPNFKFWQI